MILAITRRFYLEYFRNRISVLLLIVFPIFFLFIFSMAFGGAGISGGRTYDIIIINEDEGINPIIAQNLPPGIVPDTWLGDGVGADLVDLMLNATYPDADIPLFEDHTYGGEAYLEVMEDSAIDLIIRIPNTFSMMMLTLADNVYFQGMSQLDTNATLEFIVNPNNYDSGIAKSISLAFFEFYYSGVQSGVIPQSIQIDEEIILRQESFSIFDFIAAGLFVFSTILGATYFAAMLVQEEEWGTMSRLKISLVRPWEFILAYIVFSFVLMMVQFGVLFAAAIWFFDFNPIGSLGTAYIIMMITSLATYALIFISAAFFGDSDSVGNSLGFSSSIIGFASGAFFQMPEIVVAKDLLSFTSGSSHFLLWDFLPWTHAVNAMRAVLLFDQSLSQVFGDILMLFVFSGIWFVLGIWLYGKRRFAMED